MTDLQPVRRLAPEDDLGAFDSGEPTLDYWVRRFALSDQRASVSVTYVLTRGRRVVGFYTLTPSSVAPLPDPSRLSAGLPSGRAIPAILLARIALDRSEQGSGLGGDLLRDALLRSLAAADSIGGRAVLVQAKHERAAAFYRRYGFEPVPRHPLLFYRLMKDIRASLPRS